MVKKTADQIPKEAHERPELDGKRKPKRARRRLRVRYGIATADRTAFTKDISDTGLCIHTNMVHRPGTTLQVEIHFPDRTFSHWARVIWAKRVPPQLAHVVDCGMGLTFIEPSPEWIDFFDAWLKKVGAD